MIDIEARRARSRRANKIYRQRGHKDHDNFLARFSEYGLTLDQYHARVESQDFRCAICRCVPEPVQQAKQHNSDGFMIDHDHVLNYVRGLLCFSCNTALGLFRDRPTVCRKAAAYLEGSRA